MIRISNCNVFSSVTSYSFTGCRARKHRSVGLFLPHLQLSRTLTTTTSPSSSQYDTEASLPAGDPHRRLCMVLYRQLLRWCDDTDQTLPLSKFLPPVHIEPPIVHPASLRLVAINDPASPLARSNKQTDGDGCFPSNAIIKETEITVPIANSAVAKQLFRAIFRMNAYPPPDVSASSSITSHDTSSMRKEQISFAFEGIRSLNEISTKFLKLVQQSRDEHSDRTGVKFRVGQVVKHNSKHWRGVVLGWSRVGSNKDDKEHSKASMPSTSLTKKKYASNNPDHEISYNVAIDWGDAAIIQQSTRPISSIVDTHQSELSLVKDQDLLRIRNGLLGEHFGRFDQETQCFVPGEFLSYMYPKDTLEKEWSKYTNPSDPSARDIILGIQNMAEFSCDIILRYTSSSDAQKLSILSSLLERLTKIAHGNVIPNEERFHSNGKTPQRLMKHHLQQFMTVIVEMNDTLWNRRTSMETNRTIQYSLGQVVQHKKYGFRGVVVSWDSEPACEVSHWDGLQHIDDPEQHPFYHVIPDPNDTMIAFGRERTWRYVCEENLEPCPIDNRNIDVDLEPEWIYNSAAGMYIPPDELVFRHGGQLNDDGVTERCLRELKEAMVCLLVSIRESSTTTDEHQMKAISQHLSINKFIDVLKHAEDSDTASTLSDWFKEIWKAHMDDEVRFKLDTGANYLLKNKMEQALSLFSEVADMDPTYADAYSKASTTEYMIGNLDASLTAGLKTLELLPLHFHALNGLGLVYNEKKDIELAADSFRKSIELDPWSPVSGRLSACLTTLERWRKSTFRMKETINSADDVPSKTQN